MLYFDHSASSPPYPEVADSVQDVMRRYFANPSGLHSLSAEAGRLLATSRSVIAGCLGVEPQEVVMTSGGTESNNMAIKGTALQYRQRGKHIISTVIEHPSVQEPLSQLEEYGYEVTRLGVNPYGVVDLKELKEAIRPDTILVSMMYVNNEMGSMQPIQQIGELLKDHAKILFHVDGVQAFGKVPLDLKQWHIDMLSLSAHKFHGPRGVGLLYVRRGVQLFPLLSGGGQEAGFRSGTENLPAIVGMAQAAKRIKQQQSTDIDRLNQITMTFIEELNRIPGAVLNNHREASSSAPHIVNVSFPGLPPEVIIHALEKKEIYVSSRSACSSKSAEPSHVLLSMGLDRQRAASSIRISFSYMNTLEQAYRLIHELKQVTSELKEVVKK